MGLREVKKELNRMEKAEIIKLISEMYKNIPSVKNYLNVFATGDIKPLIEKYTYEIERNVFPDSKGTLREKEARKLIREIRKMKIVELNIELELHYVDCCLEMISDFGFYDDEYYIAIEKMFYAAMKGIGELGQETSYEKRIRSLSDRASEFGLELY